MKSPSPNQVRDSLEEIAESNLTTSKSYQKAYAKIETILNEGVNLFGPETLTSILTEDIRHRLQDIYERKVMNEETAFAERLSADIPTLESYTKYRAQSGLLEDESQLGGISKKTEVLFIGSGPFPISPILLAQLSGALVTCYDTSPEACHRSREMLRRLRLEDRVKVENESGTNGPVVKYTSIIIALQAIPKSLIFSNIAKHAPNNVKVIVRSSAGIRNFFYPAFDLNTLSGNDKKFAFVKQIQHYDIISSLYVRSNQS